MCVCVCVRARVCVRVCVERPKTVLTTGSKLKPPLNPPMNVEETELLLEPRGPPKPVPKNFNFQDFTFYADESATMTESWYKNARAFFNIRLGDFTLPAKSPSWLTPSLPQTVKFPCRKMWKRYTFLCYNTSTWNAMRFDKSPFTCQCEKENKKAKKFKIVHF